MLNPLRANCTIVLLWSLFFFFLFPGITVAVEAPYASYFCCHVTCVGWPMTFCVSRAAVPFTVAPVSCQGLWLILKCRNDHWELLECISYTFLHFCWSVSVCGQLLFMAFKMRVISPRCPPFVVPIKIFHASSCSIVIILSEEVKKIPIQA